MLIYKDDIELRHAFNSEPLITHKVFWCPFNPTAEEMAHYLLYNVAPQLSLDPIRISKVVVWETENCFAEAQA